MPLICAEMTSLSCSRNGFGASSRRYHVPNIVVAHPRIPSLVIPAGQRSSRLKDRPCASSIPRTRAPSRTSKLLLQAARILEQGGMEGFTVWLTIDGSENRYAAKLRWSMETCARCPGAASCLAIASFSFMASRLPLISFQAGDLGMPISEFQQTGKPMLVIDLPYAHELSAHTTLLVFSRQTILKCWRMRWKA